jgi:outer membrane protein assembly factor BamE (lipoprotein component of BamABCDE complex)
MQPRAAWLRRVRDRVLCVTRSLADQRSPQQVSMGQPDSASWDYLYYCKRGRVHRAQERHLIVWFKDDKVAKFERNNVPESPPMAPDDNAPIAKFPKI